MNLIKCPNGHFYDASKFQQCPHCTGAGNNDVTVAVDPQRDLATVAVDTGADAKTVAIQPQPATVTPSPIVPPPVAPAPVAPAPMPSIPTPPPQPFPIPGSAPAQKTGPAPAQNDDDDVKTVGIYDLKSDHAGDDKDEGKQAKYGIDPVVGWLVIVNGEERGRSVTLKAGRNFIGRASTNDISISGDKKISREKHAIIVFEPRSQTFLVQPGTSKSLFYVNDQVILDTKVINAYDVLNIGETNLVFIPFCGESFSWDTDDEED